MERTNTLLDRLEVRPEPIPSSKVLFNIRLKDEPQDGRLDYEEEASSETKQNVDDQPVEEVKRAVRQMKIVDKRKERRIDRELILKRMHNQEASNVYVETEQKKAAAVVPQRTDKTLTIRAPTKPDAATDALVAAEPEEVPLAEPEEVPLVQPEVPLAELEEVPLVQPEAPLAEPEEAPLAQPEAPLAETEEAPLAEKVIIKPKRRGRKPKKGEEPLPDVDVDLTTAVIRTQKVADRLPKEKDKIIIKAPSYYMQNRKIFVQKLTELFKPYQREVVNQIDNVSCQPKQNEEFGLLTHQKIVRDYLNLYTPYRGLLLYHGLGSGKTCSSIAIAEGMKTDKRIVLMTPASLKMNFFSELKKCGDEMYKKNQYWEFVSIDGNPDYLNILARALSLPLNYIRDNRGAWLVNINKEPNFSQLSNEEQTMLDDQLNHMIRSKYIDINYNGLNKNRLNALTSNLTQNPFDNRVVIIDEAHNFVSRIVNKIKQPNSISGILYNYLLRATNVKIVLLTGTPIINYPNEIGVLFNILSGYIKTWSIPIEMQNASKLNSATIIKMLDDAKINTYDFIEFSNGILTVTRNPYGFVSVKKRGMLKGTTRKKKPEAQTGGGKKKPRATRKRISIAPKLEGTNEEIEPEASMTTNQNMGYSGDDRYSGGDPDRYNGVQLNESGNISDDDFISSIIQTLQNKKNGLNVRETGIELHYHKALPDTADTFLSTFVDEESGEAKNLEVFQRRIVGMTSYFRSAQEQLLPSFEKTEAGDLYHVVKTPMTPHQFSIYEPIRKEEADREAKTRKRRALNAGKDELFNVSSTYRIFSRAACNFAFPSEIQRPIPVIKPDDVMNEDAFDVEPRGEAEIDENDDKSITETEQDKYSTRIERALEALNARAEGTNEPLFLSKASLNMFSPKFAKILENLQDDNNRGLHLLYSHFRTLEGVGVLRLILLANGFAEFKLQKQGETWKIVENEVDKDKPKFVLYTGTETAEEKEIIRNVYNGAWNFVPPEIADQLRERANNNMYGEIIKIIMITASGAEGINLKNTRYVHIVEPYWHMVRPEQVIGRARRICSHDELPEEMRTVKVFFYVTTFTEEQMTDEKNIELRIRDVSRLDKKTPVTTDETLYEIASMKQRINNQILRTIKETAVDCNIYNSSTKTNSDEQLVCYGYGKVESNNFSSYPTFERDQMEKMGLDVKKVSWKGQKITYKKNEYVLNPKTNEIFTIDSYQRANTLGGELVLAGHLKMVNNKPTIELV